MEVKNKLEGESNEKSTIGRIIETGLDASIERRTIELCCFHQWMFGVL